MERFAGKVAVVTGASAGIGASIAEKLVKHGVIVAGLARRVDRIEALAEQLNGEVGKLHGFKCDMTVEEDIVSAIAKITEELGDIHVLINNAGLSLATELINGDAAKWRTILDTNVMGLSIATREVLQDMKSKGTSGHIIHINSILGHQILDVPCMSMYSASKFAVTALTKALIFELAREKLPIKVTSVNPGYVKTEFEEVAGMTGLVGGLRGLSAEDVSDGVIYALSTPPSVNITQLTIEALNV